MIGGKYERNMDVSEIAKRVRAEIKAAIKNGQLHNGKYSVTVRRCESISILVKEVDLSILNLARIKAEREQGTNFRGDIQIYTDEARDLISRLKAIANAYNYDNSEIMTDYFDVNFYLNVSFDYSLVSSQHKALEAMIEKES